MGQFVGEDALAAVNLEIPLILMSFALADMAAVGSSVQITLQLGVKEAGAASCIFSFCSGLIVMHFRFSAVHKLVIIALNYFSSGEKGKLLCAAEK